MTYVVTLALATVLATIAGAPQAVRAAEALPAPLAGAPAKPPAPAFRPGMEVVGPTGDHIGIVQTIAETPRGLNIVVRIDGKLVGAPRGVLSLREERVVSAQTKEQLLANAGAPL